MNSKLEFKNSPQEVTIREKLDYSFDLTNWLAVGESVSNPTAKLIDEASGSEIANAISNISVSGGNTVHLTVDWSTTRINKNGIYLILIRVAIGTQFKEGFARLTTFFL
ncbi:MAG: hypothetical protein AB1631_23505 [Acidobacteriota bacterium]